MLRTDLCIKIKKAMKHIITHTVYSDKQITHFSTIIYNLNQTPY